VPDRGMWDMSELKRCGGYRGEWHPDCLKDYPDGMVPTERFSKHSGQKDGLQDKCNLCLAMTKRIRGPIYNPEVNAISKKATELAGGRATYESLPVRGEERAAFRKRAREIIDGKIESRKSEFGQSKPMTRRTITKVEGERVPEGWVYVVRNPDVPSILKIGKTFPDGIPDIMSSARRFGRAELIHKCWFSEAYRSEQSIHKVLRKYNLRVLGYTDCGKELFECSIDIAMSAILAECSDTEDAA